MKRRVMALFLALTMLIGMAPAVFAADTGFTDVAADAWYAEAVKWAVDNNITGGIGNGKFGPDQTCTRGQVVTFLWAAAGKPVMGNADNPFTDVSASDWYYNAVMWAVSNNITGGTSATTFSPNAACTRAAVVTFLYAAEGKPAVENADNSFSDVTSKHWFYAPVMWAVANDITGGIGNGKFGPDNACTRGQIALFLYKASLIGGSDEPEVTPEPTLAPTPTPTPSPTPTPTPEASEAQEYYESNAELIEVVNVEKSKDVQTEADVKSDLAAMGFGEYPISYEYDMSGAYVNETEIQDGSADKHPMYQTYYVSKNNEAWVLYVINGEVFANPLSFNLESNLGVMLLVSATEEITSYDNASNRFYVTIPHDTAVIVEHVDKIDAATLDALTIDELCKRSGAVIAADDAVPADETEAMDYALALEEAVTEVAAVDMAGATKDDPFIVVSLGDSYSSGEGIEPYYGQGKSVGEKVKDENWIAHRSENSWPGRLVISGVTEKGKTLKDYRVEVGQTSDKAIQWYFAAVSGATTVDFLFEQGKPIYQNISTVGTGLTGVGGVPYIDIYPMPRQLDVFKSIQGDVDVVTMTIGGNDAKFEDVILTCVTNFEYLKFGEISNLEEFLQDLWNGVDKIIASIHTAYAFTEEAAGEQAKIIVAGYPKLLDEKGYPPVIVSAEAKMINEKVSAFNDKIEELVKSCRRDGMNIYFVDVEDEFDKDGGHPAYSKNQWIEPITIPVKYQDINHREFASSCSMHPTSRGAQAYADCVNAEIKRINESDGIKGVVVYEGKPVNSGSITFSKSGYAVTAHTYEKGAFFVDYVPAGTYDITVVADGHDMLTIEKAVTVTGEANWIDIGKIELKEKAPVVEEFEPIEITFSTSFYSSQSNVEVVGQAGEMLAEMITERTGGAVTVKYYGESKKDTYAASLAQANAGANWMGLEDPTLFAEYVGDCAIFAGPMLYASYEEYNHVMGSSLMQDVEKNLADKHNIKILATNYTYGFRSVFTNKVIKNPEDLKNVIIRVGTNELIANTVVNMGATPQAMSLNDAISSIFNGTIHGYENNVYSHRLLGLYEALHNCALTRHLIGAEWLFISNNVWEKIPADYQQIILECAEECGEWAQKENAKLEAETVEYLEKNGVTFNNVDADAFAESCKPVFDWLVQEYDADPALRGKIMALVKQYRTSR